tara:strand:+ start:4194 stop:4838 length:645 start_codon:yes stop_codon:yes gene_type:complete
MTEIKKRIITSLFLLIIFGLSFFNIYFMTILLFFVCIQVFNEFFNIFKKIFIKQKFRIFLILTLILIIVSSLIISIWLTFYNNIEAKQILILKIITICISSDIGGFVFGNLFKWKKLTKISPNKTYSGVFGAYIFSLIFFNIFFYSQTNFIEMIFFVLVLSTISQAGDIFISFLKRKAMIKDTGNILPGHGGILDRFDGLIFAIPSGYILIKIL